jgi:hypothetical protein
VACLVISYPTPILSFVRVSLALSIKLRKTTRVGQPVAWGFRYSCEESSQAMLFVGVYSGSMSAAPHMPMWSRARMDAPTV